MKSTPRLLFCIFGFVSAALLLTACGLEEFVHLHPPVAKNIIGDNTFDFTKTLYNCEDQFRGFELYYKMYRFDETPVLDVFTHEDFRAKEFRRIHSSADRVGSIRKPLIEIHPDDREPPPPPDFPSPNNDVFTITIDFSPELDLVDPYPQFNHDAGSPPPVDTVFEYNTSIRRGVNYVTSGEEEKFKKFTEFNEGDEDITSDIWTEISNGVQIKIVVYVVSYGFDFNDFKAVYSEPVYLGEVNRIFPNN